LGGESVKNEGRILVFPAKKEENSARWEGLNPIICYLGSYREEDCYSYQRNNMIL